MDANGVLSQAYDETARALRVTGDYLAGTVLAAGTVASGGVASIDVGSIPATYRHLEIELLARSEAAAAGDGLRLRFNGDTGNNYHSQRLTGSDSTAAATAAAAAAFITIGQDALPAASAEAGRAGLCRIWVPNYANTTWHKIISSNTGRFQADAAGGFSVSTQTAIWENTAAVTSLSLFAGAGDIAEGSIYRVIGVGSAA